MLESWYIQCNQTTLNRERGTLPEVYVALLDWWTFTLILLPNYDWFVRPYWFCIRIHNHTDIHTERGTLPEVYAALLDWCIDLIHTNTLLPNYMIGFLGLIWFCNHIHNHNDIHTFHLQLSSTTSPVATSYFSSLTASVSYSLMKVPVETPKHLKQLWPLGSVCETMMNACLCVCVHVHAYICMHVCISVHIYSMCGCVHMYIYICMRVCRWLCV